MSSWWKKWTASLDLEPDIEDTLLREFSYFPYISGLFLPAGKWAVYSVPYALGLFIILVVMGVLFAVTLIKMPTDLVEMSRVMTFFGLVVICLTVIVVGHLRRDRILTLLRIISEDFYDYGDALEMEDEEDWKKELLKFKIMLFGIPSYFTLIGVVVMTEDWIDGLFGYDPPTEPYDEAGIYQLLPLRLWLPFTVTGPVVHYAMLLASGDLALAVALIAGGSTVAILRMSQVLILQLRILRAAILKTDERAENMFTSLTKGRRCPKHPLRKSTNKKFEASYNRTLKQVVEHHIIVQEYFEAFSDVVKWPFAGLVVNEAIILALSIFAFLEGANSDPSVKLQAVLLVIGEVFTVTWICEVGQQIWDRFEDVRAAFYETNWTDWPTSSRRSMIIIKERMKRPMALLAGGMATMNRDLFSSMMRRSYQYLNLLRATE